MDIRYATRDDVSACKALADRYKDLVGFVLRPVLEEAVEKKHLIVGVSDAGDVVAFCNFRHCVRGERRTTIYEIAVREDYRKRAIALQMQAFIIARACEREHMYIQAKSVASNELATAHFKAVGYTLFATEKGKKRPLNVWRLML